MYRSSTSNLTYTENFACYQKRNKLKESEGVVEKGYVCTSQIEEREGNGERLTSPENIKRPVELCLFMREENGKANKSDGSDELGKKVI